ncbi:MAG: hypothetical protein ACRDKE_05750 [Solirubrobacterales bacterium]
MTERTGKPASEHELAALADGTLGAERRREIENQLASSEQIRNSIDRQRAAIELTRELEVPATDALHARVAEMSSAAAPRRRHRFAVGGFAAATAAILVALAIVLAPWQGDPTVSEVMAVAAGGPVSGAPAKDAGRPGMLAVSVGTVQFPTWEPGWKATGTRTDTVGGREVKTVFYSNAEGATIKYAVVDGAPIDTIDPSVASYELTRSGDSRRILWRAGGHTCIIEARGVAPDALERLIA